MSIDVTVVEVAGETFLETPLGLVRVRFETDGDRTRLVRA